jgi:hypothetical protein
LPSKVSPGSNEFKNGFKKGTRNLKNEPEMAPKENQLVLERFPAPPHPQRRQEKDTLKSSKRLPKMSPEKHPKIQKNDFGCFFSQQK